MLSKINNANSFESLTDVLITFDMRASYSASLQAQHHCCTAKFREPLCTGLGESDESRRARESESTAEKLSCRLI
jgi:hypothetical protein